MSDDIDRKSKNEHGKPLYPKLVYPGGPGTDPVRVNNIKHEQEIMGVPQQTEQTQQPPSTDQNVNVVQGTGWGSKN